SPTQAYPAAAFPAAAGYDQGATPSTAQYQAGMLPTVQYQGGPLPAAQTPSTPAPAYRAEPQSPYDLPAGNQVSGYLPYPTSSPAIQGVQAAPYAGYAHLQPPSDSGPASVPSGPTAPAVSPPEPVGPRGAQLESPDPVADLTLCEGAQILARVGSEVILASEILPMANEMLSGVEGFQKAPENERAKAQEQLVKKILPQHVDMKLLYVDAKRNLPAEAIENINKQLSKRYEETELPDRLKKLKLESRRELDVQLAAWGTSVENEKRAFIEKSIAQQWVFEKIRKEDDISHEELLDYYQAHSAEYDHPTRVRWEELEATFKHHPDKAEAWQLIATMGNEVQQGRPLAEVAKERSEGIMASSGGQRDWLTQGSLKSEVLDRALFSLPVGQLSPILEDETGFHIVRVIEREDAYRTPFEKVQGDIRESLKNEHKQTRLKDLVARLRDEIPVWTIFDPQTADTRPAAPSSAMRF
ncbi:MAG: peptidylprolyl isomerase, partial [Thermoguttaceae bacterium]